MADAQRLAELLAEAKATVTSTDHTVTVTVAPGNAVTAIELAQQARRHSGAELGALIVETIEAANAQLREELTQAAAELGPTASQAVALIGGELPDPGSFQGLGPALPDFSGLGLDDGDLGDPEEPDPELRDFMRRYGVEDEIMAAVAQVKEFRAKVEEQFTAYAEARERMAGQSATVTSPNGDIEVTVKNGVGVTRIEIDDEALRHGPTKLGPMVLSTIQQANAQLAMGMAEPAQRFSGPRLNIKEMVQRYQPADDAQQEPSDEAQTTRDRRPWSWDESEGDDV